MPALSGKAIRLWLVLCAAVIAFGCTPGLSSAPDQTVPSPSSKKPAPHSSAVSSGKVSSPRSGGELVIGSLGSLPAYDPLGYQKRDMTLSPFESLTHQGLLIRMDDNRLAPALAKDYRVDRSSGKPVIQLTLNPHAKWSDGKPVSVEDVQFTYEIYAHPHFYGVWREPMHLVAGVSAYRSGTSPHVSGIRIHPQSQTVSFELDKDDVRFLQVLTAPLLPRHVWGGKHPADLEKWSDPILGTGPFQLHRRSSAEWELTANPYYGKHKPFLDKVRIRVVEDGEMVREIRSGRVHWGFVSPAEAAQVEKDGSLIRGTASGYHLLGFNLASEKLKDDKVRRALVMAVDAKQLADEVFAGYAKPIRSVLSPRSFAYGEGQLPAPDRKEAEAILKQAGYSDQTPLRLSLYYATGNSVREWLVDSLIRQWQGLPVRIEKKGLAPDAFVAHLYGGSPYDLFVEGWKYPQDPADLYRLWHSAEVAGELGLNVTRFRNAQVDHSLIEGRKLLPVEQRKSLFVSLQKNILEKLPVLPLLEADPLYGRSAKLKGVPETVGTQPFAHIEDWWLER